MKRTWALFSTFLSYIFHLLSLLTYIINIAAAAAKSLQVCPTLYDPIDGSPLGSPVPGILQARTLDGLPFPSPMHENEKSEIAQSCPTHRDPMDCSLPGSSIHGIFQARVLEWVAIAFSELTFLDSIHFKSKKQNVIFQLVGSPSNWKVVEKMEVFLQSQKMLPLGSISYMSLLHQRGGRVLGKAYVLLQPPPSADGYYHWQLLAKKRIPVRETASLQCEVMITISCRMGQGDVCKT